MTRADAVRFLIRTPYKFGHMVGFTKLTGIHNGWMRKNIYYRDGSREETFER